MKKVTMYWGLIAAIIFFLACIFKMLHFPGAGVGITLGMLLFMIYAVLLFTDKKDFTENNLQQFVRIFILIIMIVVPVSALFKIMHWPGAGITLYISHGLLVVLIPVLFYRAYSENDNYRKLNYFNEAMLLTFIEGLNLFLTFR